MIWIGANPQVSRVIHAASEAKANESAQRRAAAAEAAARADDVVREQRMAEAAPDVTEEHAEEEVVPILLGRGDVADTSSTVAMGATEAPAEPKQRKATKRARVSAVDLF
eukprot:COSAG05_NODE_3445_length_2058_cov_20.512506_4_plen_110_part_00